MDTRELTCINCPMGCRISVTIDAEEIISITGNTCKRGEIYARTEVTAPVRNVTTTIKVMGGVQDRVSCKTREPVPKEKVFEEMDEVNKASCQAPVKTGDTLIEDCAGTGIPVVATKNVRKLVV